MTTDVTIIPDIHADPARLARSLHIARGSDRLAFLGDFIDAGSAVAAPDDAPVLEKVRGLCEAGDAAAVMGNHELNAILFHRFNASGKPLRAHEPKNLKQHQSFCTRFGIGSAAALDWTEWFLGLPLWRDLGGLRLVHAFWSDGAIATIAARRPDGRLHVSDLEEVAAKETAFAKAVDLLVSGPEIPLPTGVSFTDAAGHRRTDVRIAWWRSDAPTWRAAALSVPDPSELPDGAIGPTRDLEFYRADAPPVLVGHYKMTGPPRIETAQAACLDYPKRPCVYRWRGERCLSDAGLAEIGA